MVILLLTMFSCLKMKTCFFFITYITIIISCYANTNFHFNFNENFKHKEYDPFVVSISNENEVLPALPIGTSESKAVFYSSQARQLVPVCSAETENETIANRKEGMPMLFEHKSRTNSFCKNPSQPYYLKNKPEFGDNCGKNGIGLTYFVGYSIQFIDRKIEKNPPKIEFVDLYEICYSETKGTLFTRHALHPTLGLNNQKLSQEHFEQLKLHRIRRDVDLNETYKNKKPNEKVYQFVPHDDMELVPWKNATLFDINTVLVDESVKNQLDDITNIFRNLSNEINRVFTVYSGITEISSDSKWYWKVLRRNSLSRGLEALGILIFYSKSENNNPQLPCENSEEVCKQSGLGSLQESNPNFFCCLVNQSFTDSIGLVATINSHVKYPIAELLVIFPQTTLSLGIESLPRSNNVNSDRENCSRDVHDVATTDNDGVKEGS